MVMHTYLLTVYIVNDQNDYCFVKEEPFKGHSENYLITFIKYARRWHASI